MRSSGAISDSGRTNVVILDLGMLNEESDNGKRHNWCEEAIKTRNPRAGYYMTVGFHILIDS
jgi:hypothetical protein